MSTVAVEAGNLNPPARHMIGFFTMNILTKEMDHE
jgi:hypothetical protein